MNEQTLRAEVLLASDAGDATDVFDSTTSTGAELASTLEFDAPAESLRPRLTDRQALILRFINDTVAEKGYPPTLREIGARFGIRSTNGVNDHLVALERKGYLRRTNMRSRTLQPLARVAVDPPEPTPIEAWRAENEALRRMLARVRDAGRRLPRLSAEMIVLLGDIEAILRSESPQ